MTNNSICLVDFCGYSKPGHFPITYWVDYHPDIKLITFGGEWQEIAPVYSEAEPTEDEIEVISDFAWWRVAD